MHKPEERKIVTHNLIGETVTEMYNSFNNDWQLVVCVSEFTLFQTLCNHLDCTIVDKIIEEC